MPATLQPDKVLVTCPHCGHQRPEPRAAISTVCRKCGQYFRVQEALRPSPKTSEPAKEQRRIICFECGAALEVPMAAQSTMCKRCSRYVDLHDYHIASAVSRNFKTKGQFVLAPKGYVFNTEAIVGDAVIKGKFLGKLVAERTLTIYSSADIRGTFTAARFVIPVENHFRWKEPIQVGSAEIAGELAANLHAKETIVLKSTARMFGDVEAVSLVVEDGAVMVGHVRIGAKNS